MEKFIRIHQRLSIPVSELRMRYVRSSGPGGQNVNKVNSKAILKWNVLRSSSLSEFQSQRILTVLKNKLNAEGVLVISSDRFRDQPRNRQDCIDKFIALIQKALARPKARKKTKKSKSADRKRLEQKKARSELKKSRRSPGWKE